MKIRDLQQYIQLVCGEVPQQIGTPEDKFLIQLRGESKNLDFIKSTTTFASETYIQIFYEFLQNADDAQATQMYFCFDEENLLVINNGKPFYTEQPIKEKGQLRGFLREKDTDKSPQDIGKHGMGSKLLYDFFLDVHNDLEKREQIYKALVKEHKSPILFSWSSKTDLEFDDIENYPIKDCNDIDYPLLSRIIYTYYPAMPNETKTDYLGKEINLFPQSEQSKFFKFFQECLEKYNISKSVLTSGTALYITLGEGQAELLQKELDKGKITEDIAVSLFFLKNTNRVQINDEVINQKKVESQFFIEKLSTSKLPQYQPKEDEEAIIKTPTLELLFPKNSESLDKKVSNFFLYFPILNLQLGYKFIINSNTFSTKPDRQDIAISDNEQHNRKTIEVIGLELGEYVEKLRETEQKEKHIAFFKCFLDSENKVGYEFYEENIYDNLHKAFSQNIPTENGFRNSAEHVKIKDTNLKINPKYLGLNEYDWLHPNLKDYQDKVQDIFDEIETWNIIDLLNEAKAENIVQWIKKRSKRDYQTLLDELVGNTSKTSDIADIPFIKFDNGEFYSLEEVLTKDNPYFLITDKTKGIKEILQRCGAVISEGIIDTSNPLFTKMIQVFDNDVLLFDKINTFLTIHRGKFNHHDKWNIFRNFHDQFNINILAIKNKITKELVIFQNQKDEYKILCELHPQANDLAPSGILSHYQMKYSEKEFDDFSEIYQYTLKDKPNDIWNLFYENWEEIHLKDIKKKVSKNPKNIEKIYHDLETLYEQNDEKNNINDLNFVYTTENEFVSPSEVLYHEKLLDFSESDYKKLTTFLAENTDYKFIPFEHLQAFETYISNYANATSCNNLNGHFTKDDFITIEKNELLLFQKLKSSGEQFFAHFVVKEEETTLCLRKKLNGQEYYSEDKLLNDYLKKHGKYILLPSKIKNEFQTEGYYQENEVFIRNLIREYGAAEALIDAVSRRGSTLVKFYLSELKKLNLNASDDDYKRDSFESRLIEITVKENLEEDLRNKIYINNKELVHFRLKDIVSISVDKIDKPVDFLLSELLEDYKGKSDVLDNVRGKFKISTGSIFDQTTVNLDYLKQELEKITLTKPIQLAFLVAYHQAKKIKISTLNTSITDNTAILQTFFEKDLVFYPGQVNIGFTPKNCLQSPDPSLLLEEEKLPIWVQNWLNTHKDKKKAQIFLEAIGVNPETHTAIQVREALKINQKVNDNNIDILILSQDFVKNTFEWFADGQESIKLTEDNYLTITLLINKYIIKYKQLPEYLIYFQSEGHYLYQKRKDTSFYFDTKFNVDKLIRANLVLIDARKYKREIKEILKSKGIVKVYVKNSLSEIVDNIAEWDRVYYREWKKDSNIKYRIKVSDKPLPFKYYLKYEGSSEERLISENKDGHLIMIEQNSLKNIYLYPKASPNLSVLQILQTYDEDEEQTEKLFFKTEEKSQFLKLMSLALPKEEDEEMVQRFQEINPSEKDLNMLASIKQQGNQNLSPEDLTNFIDIGQKLTPESIELLKKIIEKYGEEKLENLLDSEVKDDIEENTTESYRQIIGYVGEQLILQGLQSKYDQIEQVSTEDDFAGYDIEAIKDDTPTYIEVKTTVGSIKDNSSSVALKLGMTQYNFIIDKKPENYHLARVSLEDLGLAHIARELKNEEFNEKTKEKIDKDIREVLKKSPKLLNDKENKALLLFKMSYSDIVKLLGIE
jgi:hypothetical protein